MNNLSITHKPLIALVVLAFAVLPLGATAVKSPAPDAARSSQNHANYQAWLTKQVQNKLETIPWYGVFDILQYKVDGTTVTLKGQVVNPSVKSDAENAVKKIEGVTQVVNQITILPASAFDDQIRRAEYRAIFSEPSLSRYSMGAIPSIHIIVAHGHVTLEGVVDNQMDSNLATMRAKLVPDVFTVTNHLVVG